MTDVFTVLCLSRLHTTLGWLARVHTTLGYLDLFLTTLPFSFSRSYIDAGRRWSLSSAGIAWSRSINVQQVDGVNDAFTTNLCTAQGHSEGQQVR